MATHVYEIIYDHQVEAGLLELKRAIDGTATWEDTRPSVSDLCDQNGSVDDRDGNMKLLGVKDGNPVVVMTLKGASWSDAEGDRGDASCSCCSFGCDAAPSWKLAVVE